MSLTLTLTDVMTGPVAIPDHLDPLAFVPVVGRAPVAQGDLMVCPQAFPSRKVVARKDAAWSAVPAEGVKIIDGSDNGGGHDHVLVAAPGTATVTFDVDHPSGLAICLISVTDVASIQHIEHGAIILTPDNSPFECRGQREQADIERRVAD